MSQHQFFRRTAVPAQVATKQETITFPAPTRGIIQSENESYMQPGSAVVMENWLPTMKGAKIRGGCEEWCVIPSTTTPPTFASATIANVTLSGSNLIATNTGGTSNNQGARVPVSIAQSTGKYYFEMAFTTLTATGSSVNTCVGIAQTDATYTQVNFDTTKGAVLYQLGQCGVNANTFSAVGQRASGDVIGIAVDLDNNKIWWRVAPSGNWNGNATHNPGTNTGGFSTVTLTKPLYPYCGFGGPASVNGNVITANFGATAFVGAVPSGFFAGWIVSAPGEPLISAFEYASGTVRKMFFCNPTKIYDTSTTTPVLVASGRTSGNNVASQFANQGGDWMIVANDAGDPLLRFNGTTWTSLATTTPTDWVISHAYAINDRARDPVDGSRWKCLVAHTSPGSGTFAAARAAAPTQWGFDMAPDGSAWIIGPAGTAVENGAALTYVCKYRNRLFFVERNSMNAWYLGIDAVGGQLNMLPLAGATTKGGHLLFCANWSIDAGDGIDDKICFVTDQGEAIIFTGSNPSDAANWRQEGRYNLSPPMGMNAHLQIGGDLLIACVDGILPMSGAITKDRAELELAAITRSIKPLWREQVLDKREFHWTMNKWDEFGGIFTTFPGGKSGKQLCLATNAATGAHAKCTGWDAMCFAQMRGDCFFGTQTGRIMQMDRTGYDDGLPYTCTLVGGWEVFQSPSQMITWKQARASFSSRSTAFAPQLSSTTDYVVILPTPPSAAPDPGVLDIWDEGLWDDALWDVDTPTVPVMRNTGWVSIGITGFSHAPIVQVTMAQVAKPEVELISIAGVFERLAITV